MEAPQITAPSLTNTKFPPNISQTNISSSKNKVSAKFIVRPQNLSKKGKYVNSHKMQKISGWF